MDPRPVEAIASAKAPADAGALRPRHRFLKDVLTAAGLAVVLVAAVLAVGYFRYGDLPSFLAVLRGDELMVSVRKLPEEADGNSEQHTFNVSVRNLTSRSFRVLGINDNCDCITVEGIPAAVGAGESKEIRINVRFSPGQSQTGDVMLITDDARLNQIRVTLL